MKDENNRVTKEHKTMQEKYIGLKKEMMSQQDRISLMRDQVNELKKDKDTLIKEAENGRKAAEKLAELEAQKAEEIKLL